MSVKEDNCSCLPVLRQISRCVDLLPSCSTSDWRKPNNSASVFQIISKKDSAKYQMQHLNLLLTNWYKRLI